MTISLEKRRLGGRARNDLFGLAILLVEDDFFQARDTQQALQHSGARVLGPARDAETALRYVSAGNVTCAIVDIDLGKGASFDIASALLEQRIPFLFMTGMDPQTIPATLTSIPVMRKPVDYRALLRLTAEISVQRQNDA